MIRKIVKIDSEKCNGCGLCVDACHEGAIGMKEGKAHLLRDDYCDGLGDCLPACPTGAITFEEREALPYDEAAVEANMAARNIAPGMASHTAGQESALPGASGPLPCGCPGSQSRSLMPEDGPDSEPDARHAAVASSGHAGPANARPKEYPGLSALPPHGAQGGFPGLSQLPGREDAPGGSSCSSGPSGVHPAHPVKPLGPVGSAPSGGSGSQLRQWPVQIKLVPVNAPYLNNAHLLIAADCTAYAYGNFHRDFIQGRVTLIGCPKLDQPAYYEKLLEIFKSNNIKSVTIARMSVPCCGGLEQAAKKALQDCGKMIPWNVVTITPEGKVLED